MVKDPAITPIYSWSEPENVAIVPPIPKSESRSIIRITNLGLKLR